MHFDLRAAATQRVMTVQWPKRSIIPSVTSYIPGPKLPHIRLCCMHNHFLAFQVHYVYNPYAGIVYRISPYLSIFSMDERPVRRTCESHTGICTTS
ncbi:hypothetical protein CC2G_005967 [Coprinopsis cinerea AmutBmut pab1-1]|nr:hypothetical protein CC2G_005967 [Coprinopsis cinerea AmutBmut pab1-1]